MIDIIFGNLRRRPGRALLTAIGIAVGVATIVALLALGAGMQQTAGGLVHLGGADLGIFQRAAADPTTSILPSSFVRRVARQPDVAEATPLDLLVQRIPGQPSAITFGVDPHGFVMRRAVLEAGRRPGPGEAMIGDGLASRMRLGVGGRITIGGDRLRVSGVYHSGVAFEDIGAIVTLDTAHRISGRPAEEITTIGVRLASGVSAGRAAAAITRALPGVQVISSPGQAARLGANSVLIGDAVLLIVVLALIVGGLGVANTMLMSVLERQREIALLATVGWSRLQLAGLVLGEAVLVSLGGAGLGLLGGLAAGSLLGRLLSLGDFISPVFQAWGLGRGLLVGVAIGLVGGLYPAWRVGRTQPAEVLAGG